MSYEWDIDSRESKADKRTDFLGFGEIGGVGQLVYHQIRFADYEWLSKDDPEFPVKPIINEKCPPEIDPKGSLTGKEVLISLCELARRIDSFDESIPYYILIVKWCKEHIHPYETDWLYRAVNDKSFDLESMDSALLARDATFTIDRFMKDLEKLYNAARYYIALDALCVLDNDTAYNLYQEGKHFEAPSVFESYKYNHEIPGIDVSSANGDIVKEMILYNEYKAAHPEEQPTEGEFAAEPYDDYEKLREGLIEYIPDFRLRLKLNPKTNTLVFSADVTSVFDIAWYTLARMLSEEPPLEKKGYKADRPEGIMICCHHCGRFFFRNARHQQYCDSVDCQKARNAKNQREFRRRKADERAKAALMEKRSSKSSDSRDS